VFTLEHRIAGRSARIRLLAAVAGLGIALPTASASAQGLFDFLFGPPRSPSANSYADPNSPLGRPESAPRPESGPSVSYCVRLCDGRFFPIQRSSGANPAQVCGASCPATRTKVFSGGTINYAVANDGARYADLPSAFAYRDRVVANCTCNGKDTYGLVTTDVAEDPTLRAGDIVATERGFVAYSGSGRRQSGEFTPIESAGAVSGELRERLSGTKIVPRDATPVAEQGAVPAGDRRVQLDR